MRPKTNPHLDLSSMVQAFPPGHPAREQSMLTPYQQMALPMLLWFLDPQRHRGEGRTTLLAHAVIELAMRGYAVPLDDISQFITSGPYRRQHYFLDVVSRILSEHYKGHLFEMKQKRSAEMELTYHGRRPR